MDETEKKAAHMTISFEGGWPVLQEAVDRLIGIIDGVSTEHFSSDDYMRFYTIAYEICQPDNFGPGAHKLYAQQKKTFEDFIRSKILPNLCDKKDEILLRELVQQWEKLKIFTKCLSRFLYYLNRYFVPRYELPSVTGTSYLLFYSMVNNEQNDQVIDLILSMIDCERKGEEIDQALVEKVLDLYVEMGEGTMKYYEKYFERPFVKSTAEFYAERSSIWITSDSYKDYMLKVDRCFEQEKERISCYLQQQTQYRLLQTLRNELIYVHESKARRDETTRGRRCVDIQKGDTNKVHIRRS